MEPRDQIIEVQSVLDRLTRFRHINGWAAVAAGVLSLIAYIGICYMYKINWLVDSVRRFVPIPTSEIIEYALIIGGLLVAAGAVGGTIILASLPRDLTVYAWRNLLKLVAIYALYIISGGAMVWALLNSSDIVTLGMLQIIPPMMCIFYGLAQFHSAQISLSSLKYLGAWMLLCGIVGCVIPSLGWFMWMLGFGPGHIAIGLYVVYNSRN